MPRTGGGCGQGAGSEIQNHAHRQGRHGGRSGARTRLGHAAGRRREAPRKDVARLPERREGIGRAAAAREGYVSVEHTKRYTTLGMATDQGKLSNINGLAVLADALSEDIPAVGTTTFRPPYTPVTLGALAGESRAEIFQPLRCTPMHAGTRPGAPTWSRWACGAAPIAIRRPARPTNRPFTAKS